MWYVCGVCGVCGVCTVFCSKCHKSTSSNKLIQCLSSLSLKFNLYHNRTRSVQFSVNSDRITDRAVGCGVCWGGGGGGQ